MQAKSLANLRPKIDSHSTDREMTFYWLALQSWVSNSPWSMIYIQIAILILNIDGCKHALKNSILIRVILTLDHGKYGPWGPWSACGVSCGDGTKTRSRVCVKPRYLRSGTFLGCEGASSETATCYAGACKGRGAITSCSPVCVRCN